jgi:two-component system sensor histidine kinase KdpD
MTSTAGRRDPDQLLAAIQTDEQQAGRGRLLVFLGYAAGVGKTYAMLQGAQQRQAEGVDLAVGYVETHGRAETDALLSGLEIIPRRQCPAQRDGRRRSAGAAAGAGAGG